MTYHIPYDAWLHWQITNFCNLNCKYCLTKIKGKNFKPQPVNIERIISTLDKSNRIYRINFTGGGEPFMVPNLKELCIELTKKHYIFFNSNLTSPRIKDFINTINPERIWQFNASTHLEQLFDKKLAERFSENFNLIKSRNIRIRAAVVAYPTLLSKLTFYRDFFSKRNIHLEFDLFIGEYKGKSYPAAYTREELDAFGIKENWSEKYIQKNQVCNAGYNVGIVMGNGNIYPCSNVYMKLGNIFEEIRFKENLIRCPSSKCDCPFNLLDTPLFKKATDVDHIQIKKMSPALNSILRLRIMADYYKTRNI